MPAIVTAGCVAPAPSAAQRWTAPTLCVTASRSSVPAGSGAADLPMVWRPTSDPGSEQGGGPLGGVGLTVDIQRGGRGKPGRRLIVTPQCLERVRVRVPESGRAGSRPVPVEPATREYGQRCFRLTTITARTGHDDEQFGARLRVELGHTGIAQHPHRLTRATEGSLAIGQQRQVPRVAGDAARSAQLVECFAPLAGTVGGDADRLPNDGEP